MTPQHDRGSARGRLAGAITVTLLTLASLLATTATPAAAQDGERPPNPVITFEGAGWGHGVGMSQYGAHNRALAGQSVRDILGFYYPGTQYAVRDTADDLRVHLVSARRVEIVSTGVVSIVGADGSVVWTSPGAVRLVAERTPRFVKVTTPNGVNRCIVEGRNRCGASVTVEFVQGEPVTVTGQELLSTEGSSGRAYQWGHIQIHRRTGEGLWGVIGGLSMQQYLYGLAEVPASWPAAALQAQAVAGRTFAYSRLLARRAPGSSWAYPHWDLWSSVSDQVYYGLANETHASAGLWKAAVDATDDRVLLYGGSPISAFYSSSNGPHTEDSGYVFVTSLPYLPAQPDPFDSPNPNATWERSYRGGELRRWLLRSYGVDVGVVQRVTISGDIGASGRTDRATVTLFGPRRSYSLSGYRFMVMVNSGTAAEGAGRERQLLSTLYAVRSSPPEGEVERIRRVGNRVVARGWVADADRDDVTVELRIAGRTRATRVASTERADIVTDSGAPARGFVVRSRIGAPARRVCVVAVDASTDEVVRLGCRRV